MATREKHHRQQSYLSRLRFDRALKGDAVWKYIVNMRFVVLLVVGILFMGLVSYLSIPKRLNPEIKIPIVTVVTVLPGAAPADVESLVTIPVESAIQNIGGIDTMSSVSQDNVSAITLQFKSSVVPDKARADVQSAVDGVVSLPDDAQTPMVKALDFEDQPVWTFALSGPDLPSVMRMTDILRKKLESTPNIDRVVVNGYEKPEVAVVIPPEKIAQYGINPALLAQSVRAGIKSYPSGIVDTGENSFAVTVDPQITSVEDIRAMRISVDGKSMALGDLAQVSERSAANQHPSFLASFSTRPTRAVTVNVYKSSTANIDEAEKAATAVVKETLAHYGNRYTVTSVLDTAELINTQFYDLLGEFRSTIILVFASLFVFLGLRQALIASFTVPLTFLASFAFMRYLGMSINFLSLFAFLLALGLLVDDTIVTVSAMTSYFRSGKFTPVETGRMVWRDTIIPIWSTTITTIWSFVPLLLASGIIGEFIKPIPIVVTVTMISSTAIAVLITLPLMIVLLKPEIPARVVTLLKLTGLVASLAILIAAVGSNPLLPIIVVLYLVLLWIVSVVRMQLARRMRRFMASHRGVARWQKLLSASMDNGILDLERVSRKYHWLILRILRSKRARRFVIWGIVAYAVWAFALLPMGFVKNEFFPKSDEDTVYLNLSMPSGTNSETTVSETVGIADRLRKTAETQFVTADTGVNMGDMGAGGNGDNLALFTLHLTPKASRSVSSVDIADRLRKAFAGYDRGTLTVVEESSGPPAGSDLQMKLLGDDLGQLTAYADQIAAYLSKVAGVTDVKKSIKPGTGKLVFAPDKDKLAYYGISVDSLGLWLRSFASGFTLSDAKYETDTRQKKDIVFSFGSGMETPELISAISIPAKDGDVPLLGLGHMEVKSNPAAITRESGKRTISVSATVRPGYNTAEINSGLESFVSRMNFADGYSWKTGGVNDENRKSVESILQAMGLAFILILVTMVIQFQSYRQALLVLLVIPLAVSSVFMVFALTGTPLSFPALIGVLSLFGIVVTNSMFIVDKININLREGMPFEDALADAGSSRMEPIILTKLCTVFGLLPVTIASPLWRGLGGAIISGLLIASTIMLLFIPVVYYEWFRPKKNR